MNGKGKNVIRGIGKYGVQVLAAVLFLACAWWIAYAATENELIVPSLGDCVKKAVKLLGDGWFWSCFFATLGRVFFAFLISFLLATIFAVISYLLPSFRVVFTPIIAIFRSLPVLAVALILLVWCGAGATPIAVAFLSLFPMLYTSVLTALSQTDEELIEMSCAYNVPLKRRIFSLYLPSAAPYVVKEGGAALSFALKLVVSAEVLVSTFGGLGGMLQEAKAYLDMPTLFGLVILTFLVALLFEGVTAWLARTIERRVK